MSGTLTTEIAGDTGWIIISNPARANAMTFAMWQALPTCVEELENADAVRVIAVKGAGDRSFVSGADVSEFETVRATAEGAEAYDRAVDLAVASLREARLPTLAAIRGYCLGGGMGIALACDLRYAREDAVFGIPAARLGVGYSYALTQDLVRATGSANAREILYTARRYAAREAVQMGLVNRMLDHGHLSGAVHEVCEDLAKAAPLTVRTAKRAILEASATNGRADLVGQMVSQCFASEDFIEGRNAFLEKREPRFKGK